MTTFELEWYGGLPAARLRRRRGNVGALPWGTLETRDLAASTVLAARRSFAEGAWNEYRAGAAFAELSRALLRARAPVDLVAMSADFVVDEMSHVELNARMAMELGSTEPLDVDAASIALETLAQEPLQQALEIAVRVSCVGEVLSAPLLATAARIATHPLTKAVLVRLASEEGAHGAIGWMILAWAGARIDAAERQRLASIAEDEIEAAFAGWTELGSAPPAIDAAGFARVGFVEPAAFLAEARHALRSRIAAPLARLGIMIDAGLLARLAPRRPPCSPPR